MNDAQEHHFGLRLYRAYGKEAKASKLLKAKTFKQALKKPPIPIDERRVLARALLEDGSNVSGNQLIALAQAKISYCAHALEICKGYNCRAFASIIPNDIDRPALSVLRKDYAFLFERYFHMLNQIPSKPMGVIVFDENDKTKNQILLNQMEEYFIRTTNGRQRSRLIIPEPLFVHSDLTTLIQMVDIVAYVINWGLRLRSMVKPHRTELDDMAQRIKALQYHAPTPGGHDTWGFKTIRSLLSATDAPETRKGNAPLSDHKASAWENGNSRHSSQALIKKNRHPLSIDG